MNEIIITDVKKYKKDNLFYSYWKYQGKEFMQTNTFEMSNDYLKNIINYETINQSITGPYMAVGMY